MTVSGRSVVDPAALLMSVVAVAVVPLAQPGAWGWLNTAIGSVVAFVLGAFYVLSPRWRELSLWEQRAVVGVFWIVLLTTLAFPGQLLFAEERCSQEPTEEDLDECRGEIGTAAGAGLAGAVLLSGAVGYGLRGRSDPADGPPPDDDRTR